MKHFSIVPIILLAASPVSTYAARPISIFTKGSILNGTCFAKYHGLVLMNGRCSGLGHRGSLFVTADKDQCSLTVKQSGQVAISAYKGDCGDTDLNSKEESIGSVQSVGNCLVGANVKVCLKAGTRIFKGAE